MTCILFMMTTHIWPGSGRILAADVGDGLHLLYVVVVDSLGRAAVPLLSMVSGALFAYSLARRPPGRIVVSKIKTLIVPMAVWSIPMVAVAFAEAWLTGDRAGVPVTPLDWGNSFFAFTVSPANGPLHFLREIFIMSLYGIAILFAWRRSRALGVLLGVGIVLIEQIPGGFLLFRNQIATFYVFGLLFACFGFTARAPKGSWLLVIALVGVLVAVRVAGLLDVPPDDIVLVRLAEHFPRIIMSIFMWRVALALAQGSGPIRRLCMALEPHIFTIFCSHILVVKVVGGIAFFAGWQETASYYPLIFAGQIVLCVFVGWILSRMLAPFPWLRGKAARSQTRPAVEREKTAEKRG